MECRCHLSTSWILCGLLLAACAGTSPAAAEVTWAAFDRIVVAPFEYAGSDPAVPRGPALVDEVYQEFVRQLARDVRHKRLPLVVTTDRSLIGKGTLVLEGSLIDVRAGDVPERLVIGFGTAHVAVQLNGRLVDGGSAAVLTEFSRRRSFSIGFMKGTGRQILMRETRALASRVADVVSRHIG
jgi:hypothetical protein